MTTLQTTPRGIEPAPTRAVFASTDFALLKDAVGDFIGRLDPADTRLNRLAALYHRIGRLA
jgi:hypothetical protein